MLPADGHHAAPHLPVAADPGQLLPEPVVQPVGRRAQRFARDLGSSQAVVRTWRGRFARLGIPGLFDKPRSGRPETHGPSARLAAVAVATSVPPEGESQWSHAMIATHLRERGLAISAATVGRILSEAKVRPHKVRGWLNRADDPSFWIRAGPCAACT